MAGPRVPGGIAHRERDASNRCDTLTLVGAVEAGRGDLLASLAALGRSLQETFDPQRFLAEFSERVQPLVPHDRLLIAYLEEGGETFTVFAEHAARGPVMHEGRYTVAFDPGGRYVVDQFSLRPVFAGEALLVQDSREDARFAHLTPEELKPLKAGVRARVGVPCTAAAA